MYEVLPTQNQLVILYVVEYKKGIIAQ
jgi:hypothetical protein